MRFTQTTLDRVRVFNKYVTNKVLIHLAGRKFGHFAVLGHTGRRSGRLYRIPVIAEPHGEGFVFALTYGKKVDWYENVMAEGGCSLFWKQKEYLLTNPRLIEREEALTAFPTLVQKALRKNEIEFFLKLDAQAQA